MLSGLRMNMLRVCCADSRREIADLREFATWGTSSLAKSDSNLSCDDRRDTPRATMPRTIVKMSAKASASLVPIFILARNNLHSLLWHLEIFSPTEQRHR